jgi:hypothetical protein
VVDNPGELVVAAYFSNNDTNNNNPGTDKAAGLDSDASSSPQLVSSWDSIDLHWFVIGLVAIGAIFAAIYASAV